VLSLESNSCFVTGVPCTDWVSFATSVEGLLVYDVCDNIQNTN
jgi:hypothetical protein